MNTDLFMPEANEADRIQVLQDTAEKVREGIYDAPLSEAEIENRKSDFFVNATKIEDLEAEKKELTRDLSDKIKEVRALNRALRAEIREGVAKKEGVLYDVANYESGYMETYDKTGELIEKRRLTPQEKAAPKTLFRQLPKAS